MESRRDEPCGSRGRCGNRLSNKTRSLVSIPTFRRLCLLGLVSAALLALLPFAAGASQTASDWPGYLLGPRHSSYNQNATSITPSNVASVEPLWRWNVPSVPSRPPTLLASPTVYGNTVYIGSQNGYVYAIDRKTHLTLWGTFVGFINQTTCFSGGTISTATVAKDPQNGSLRVYVFGQSGYVYALDAASGQVVWQAQIDTPSPTVNDYYSWSSPTVWDGKVYVGISSACDMPLVPGGVVAVDQHSGAVVARWQTLPPGMLGGSVWGSVAVARDGSLFATTGNAETNQVPNAQSIVELSAKTLKLKDAWEVPPSQAVGDGDFGASPTLFNASLGGVNTPMVGACNKNGIYYAFRRGHLTDGPVWRRRIGATSNGSEMCIAASVWDGRRLIQGGGSASTINGVTYQGTLRALNPANGKIIWHVGLPGSIMGTPTEDGSGLVAAPVFLSSNRTGVYLFDGATGRHVGTILLPGSPQFGQPVFAGSDLLVGGNRAVGLTDYEVMQRLSPVATITPDTLSQGTRHAALTIEGQGFDPDSSVFFSGTGVSVTSADVVSDTTIDVNVNVDSGAALGLYDVAVVQPGSPASVHRCHGCFQVVAP